MYFYILRFINFYIIENYNNLFDVGADDSTVYAVTVTSIARTVSCVSARYHIGILKNK